MAMWARGQAARLLRPSVAGLKRAWINTSRSLQRGEFSDVLYFETIQPGSSLSPEDFSKKALLVVNSASRCGYTPQLKGLQELHDQFREKGLFVLAIPSNDFGAQEPGSDEEIVAFYSNNYNVTFPIAKKVAVTGDNAHAFFQRMVKEYNRSVAPTWNFDKFVLDHRGDLRAVFPHDIDPLAPEVLEAIEEVLEELPREVSQDGDQKSFAELVENPPSSSVP